MLRRTPIALHAMPYVDSSWLRVLRVEGYSKLAAPLPEYHRNYAGDELRGGREATPPEKGFFGNERERGARQGAGAHPGCVHELGDEGGGNHWPESSPECIGVGGGEWHGDGEGRAPTPILRAWPERVTRRSLRIQLELEASSTAAAISHHVHPRVSGRSKNNRERERAMGERESDCQGSTLA